MATGTDQALTAPAVLLLGASSQIGVFAIPQLLLAGFRVIAVSRKGRPEAYPDFEQVDWLNEADAVQAAQSCQHLISAGPLELAKKFLTIGGNQVPSDPILEPQALREENGWPRPASRPVPGHTFFRVKPGMTNLSAPVTPDTAPVTPDTTSVTPGLTRGPFQTAVIFSSSSIETKQKSNNPAERSQIKGMLSLESDIQHIAENRGLKLVIFRPTLIYGCGLDTNISRLAAWIDRYGFMPVNGRAAGLRQPVHADDLASVAMTAMLSKDVLPRVMFLTGGDTLSYSDMVTKIFTALDKPTRLIRLPEWLFVLLTRFAGASKTGKGINIEMVKRQRLDLVFDDHQARELLNYNPRPFAPLKADFSLPDF